MITWVDLLVVEEGSVGEVFSPGDDEVSVEEVWSHLHNAALVSTGSQHPVDGLGGLHIVQWSLCSLWSLFPDKDRLTSM